MYCRSRAKGGRRAAAVVATAACLSALVVAACAPVAPSPGPAGEAAARAAAADKPPARTRRREALARAARARRDKQRDMALWDAAARRAWEAPQTAARDGSAVRRGAWQSDPALFDSAFDPTVLDPALFDPAPAAARRRSREERALRGSAPSRRRAFAKADAPPLRAFAKESVPPRKNARRAPAGENMRGVSAGESMRGAQAGENIRRASADENTRRALPGESMRRALPGARRTVIETPARAPAFDGGAPLDARLNGVPAPAFMAMLSQLTEANIAVGPGVTQAVSGRFDGLAWRRLLRALAELHDWRVSERDGVVRVAAAAKDAPAPRAARRVEMLRLRHIAPADFKSLLQSVFKDDDAPELAVDERARALIVRGDAEAVETAARLARRVDTPARQILIESFIVEADDDFERRLGARLGYDRQGRRLRISGAAGDAPAEEGVRLGSARALLSNLPVVGATGGIGFLIDHARLKVELTALEREGRSRIVSNPRVFTMNGREAVVFQGDEVPYQSMSEDGVRTEFKEAGVRLAVTPIVLGDKRILLDVEVNKDTVDTRLDNPPITRRHIKTRLLAADGAMVVIGGIYFDTLERSTRRVPWFGRLPMVGRLFRDARDNHKTKQLLVFILPRVVG